MADCGPSHVVPAAGSADAGEAASGVVALRAWSCPEGLGVTASDATWASTRTNPQSSLSVMGDCIAAVAVAEELPSWFACDMTLDPAMRLARRFSRRRSRFCRLALSRFNFVLLAGQKLVLLVSMRK